MITIIIIIIMYDDYSLWLSWWLSWLKFGLWCGLPLTPDNDNNAVLDGCRTASYKWIGMNWIKCYPGGVKYSTPYGAHIEHHNDYDYLPLKFGEPRGPPEGLSSSRLHHLWNCGFLSHVWFINSLAKTVFASFNKQNSLSFEAHLIPHLLHCHWCEPPTYGQPDWKNMCFFTHVWGILQKSYWTKPADFYTTVAKWQNMRLYNCDWRWNLRILFMLRWTQHPGVSLFHSLQVQVNNYYVKSVIL